MQLCCVREKRSEQTLECLLEVRGDDRQLTRHYGRVGVGALANADHVHMSDGCDGAWRFELPDVRTGVMRVRYGTRSSRPRQSLIHSALATFQNCIKVAKTSPQSPSSAALANMSYLLVPIPHCRKLNA